MSAIVKSEPWVTPLSRADIVSACRLCIFLDDSRAELGKRFVRNLVMPFDGYLKRMAPPTAFSRTV